MRIARGSEPWLYDGGVEPRPISGRFAVSELAAVGGMGEVYRGYDLLTGTVVAIKVCSDAQYDPVRHDRLMREAAILSRLDHPAIVRFLAADASASGSPILVMEWIDGKDLASLLRHGRRIGAADALAITERIAEGLAHAHERGIVHRDITPSNLIVVGGDVKILDFGIASDDVPAPPDADAGTPGYMAPELIQGCPIGPAADVFALGCVLWECLTGRRAFDGNHLMAIRAKLVLDELPRPSALVPDLPPEIDALLAHMLAKDPSARIGDGAALLANVLATKQSLLRSLDRQGREHCSHCVIAIVERSGLPLPSSIRYLLREYGFEVVAIPDGLIALARDVDDADRVFKGLHAARRSNRLGASITIGLAVGRGQHSLAEAIDRAVAVAHSSADVAACDQLAPGLDSP